MPEARPVSGYGPSARASRDHPPARRPQQHVRRVPQAGNLLAVVVALAAVLAREHDLADNGAEVLPVERPERLDRQVDETREVLLNA